MGDVMVKDWGWGWESWCGWGGLVTWRGDGIEFVSGLLSALKMGEEENYPVTVNLSVGLVLACDLNPLTLKENLRGMVEVDERVTCNWVAVFITEQFNCEEMQVVAGRIVI